MSNGETLKGGKMGEEILPFFYSEGKLYDKNREERLIFFHSKGKQLYGKNKLK